MWHDTRGGEVERSRSADYYCYCRGRPPECDVLIPYVLCSWTLQVRPKLAFESGQQPKLRMTSELHPFPFHNSSGFRVCPNLDLGHPPCVRIPGSLSFYSPLSLSFRSPRSRPSTFFLARRLQIHISNPCKQDVPYSRDVPSWQAVCTKVP